MLDFTAIPRVYLLIVFATLIAIGAALWLVGRRQGRRMAVRSRLPHTLWGALCYISRLLAFGLLALLLTIGVLMFYMDYETVEADLAPARQPVALPPDLPFTLEPVTFPSESASAGQAVQLAGWYVPPRNQAVIILLHGYGGTRLAMIWHARVLVQSGYGVLLYDERASGESTGERRSYGWEDAPDVGGALAFLQERAADQPVKVGIAGCSIGGQIALQGAVRYPEIQAVWADGPANIRAADNSPVRNLWSGLGLVSNYVLDGMSARRLGMEAPPAMIDIIGQIAPRPLMLVGGGTPKPLYGSEVPRVHYYAAYAGPNARVWIIPAATHCDGPQQVPEEYAQRLTEFFDAALK